MFKFFLGICFLGISTFSFAEPQTWYFVRHFEKQSGDNPSLTSQGKSRADNLAKYFTDKPLTAIFSTEYNRTQETAAPVAKLKMLKTQYYDPSNLSQFADQLKSKNHLLVVGHSNTTPQLIQLMGGTLFVIAEFDFGVLYIMQKNGDKLGVSESIIPL